MEIDLELPSCEMEKLDVSLALDVEVGDGSYVVQDEEEPPNYPEIVEDDKEDHESNVHQRISCVLEQADVNAVEAVVSKGSTREPSNGLEFDSKEEAYSFYREYARSVGFGITIRASRRSKKSGKFIDIKVACSRFGTKREPRGPVANPRECMKTDCKAGMHMKRKEDGNWVVHSFVKEHNHEIYPDDYIYAISRKKKQPVVVACQKKGLQLALDNGDIQLMLEFFLQMKEENRNFYYTIDLDDEKRLKNVLWVDSKGRNEYRNFCDVVFFDTFYVANKYRIPLVTISGVNNHCQYILFGCALIGEGTSSSISWLMRTWLQVVGGQAPGVVITDQEKFLKEAVADVFPDARHCFCLWHILRRIPENLGSEVNHQDFMGKFNKGVLQSWTVEQFERKWQKMVEKYGLREEVWIRALYEDRKCWVPTYMTDVFLAGMSTAERSESVVSFFDTYICPETTFKEFIELYKQILEGMYDMEAHADFDTHDKQSGLISLSPFEKQMSSIYTDEIFEKFQAEVLGVSSCHLQNRGETDGTLIFQVDDSKENQKVVATWKEEELQIRCSCHCFEYKGFLCRHALLVLQMCAVSSIPSHYILKRWTKDAKIRHTETEEPRILNSRLQRFDDLCRLATKLGEVGSVSPEKYHVALQALEEVLKICVDVNNSVYGILGPSITTDSFAGDEENPTVTKKRSMPKKRKVQSEPKEVTTGTQDVGFQMEQSRAENLNNCYIHQQDVQREPDVYFTGQHGMQGMGQQNSASPIGVSDNYYTHQLGIQGQLGFRVPTLHDNNLQDSCQSVDSSQYHIASSKHFQNKNPSW